MAVGRKETSAPMPMEQLAREVVSTSLLLRGLHMTTRSAEFKKLCGKQLEELRRMSPETLESVRNTLQVYDKIISDDYNRGKKPKPVKEVPHL